METKDISDPHGDAMDDAAKKCATDVTAMAAKEKAKTDAEKTKTSDDIRVSDFAKWLNEIQC